MAELYPEARKLLDTVRDARTPSLADRERVLASLLAGVAVSAAAPSAVAAKTGLVGKLAGNALWVKAAASAAVLSVASASTFVYVQHRARPHVVVEPRPRAATPKAVALAPAVAAPEVVPPEVVPPEVVAPEVVPRPAPAKPTTSPERPAPAPARRAPDGLSAEAGLLREAHDARRAGQPERALELVREHTQKYPRSPLWAERETVHVLALCDLGRVDAARRSAAPLQYLWSSPLRATLNASCVGK